MHVRIWKESDAELRQHCGNRPARPPCESANGSEMNKQHAHQMLDQLDPGQFDAVSRLLEVLTDPVTTIRDAPLDDEPLNEDEERAVAASKEWFKHNDGIPFEEVVASLGFTMEQVREHK